MKIHIALLLIILFGFQQFKAQKQEKEWKKIAFSVDEFFLKSDEAIKIAENVLLYQKSNGGWGKNIQMQNTISAEEKQKLLSSKNEFKGTTIDNKSTVQELTFLANMCRYHQNETYKTAFLNGMDFLLKSQYENGGWPQFFPIQKNYSSHITYNDDAIANVLFLFKKIKEEGDRYPIKISSETFAKINNSFSKGIDIILKTQYKQKGKLSVWSAQHDEFTLMPTKARAYELPSLTGKESATLVLLLMSIDQPSKEIINAVNYAVKWFNENKLTGYKEVIIDGDKKLVADSSAPPLWGRFYDLETNQIFFSDRDGIRRNSYDEIGSERRNGYAWYTYDPAKVLKKYDDWNKKWASSYSNKNYNVVAKDGSGDYKTIQEAINHTKAFSPKRITIFIKNGIYKEKVKLHEWNSNLILKGENKDLTIITFDDYFNKIDLGRNSTFFTPTLLVEGNDAILKNLTIQNSSGDIGQAIALSINANRVTVINCKLLGNQDTLYLTGEGKYFFKNSYIEGTTDFIFGSATSFFENCEIFSKKDSYITAASTAENVQFGFVFQSCKFTAAKNVSKVFLGRPWRIFAKTAILNSTLGNHILPEGWENWNKKEAEKTSYYAEYNNYGSGSVIKNRVKWSHQLNEKQAKMYSKDNVLKDPNHVFWFQKAEL